MCVAVVIIGLLFSGEIRLVAGRPIIHVDYKPRYQAGFMINLTANAEREVEEVTFCIWGSPPPRRRDDGEEEGDPLLAHLVGFASRLADCCCCLACLSSIIEVNRVESELILIVLEV